MGTADNPARLCVLLLHVILCGDAAKGDAMSLHMQQPSPIPDPIPPPGPPIPPGHAPDDPAPVEEPPEGDPIPIPDEDGDPPMRVTH